MLSAVKFVVVVVNVESQEVRKAEYFNVLISLQALKERLTSVRYPAPGAA